MNSNKKSAENDKWNDQEKSLFNEFRKRRRDLPCPSDVKIETGSRKKSKSTDYTDLFKNNRNKNRFTLYDKNRDLMNDFNELSRNCSANAANSTIAHSDNFLNMDLSSEDDLNKTEISCDEYEQKLASTLMMIKNKDDPYVILEKIVNELALNYKNTQWFKKYMMII